VNKIKRFISIEKLFGASAKALFLFGARATGKSTLLREEFPQALFIDLLDNTVFYNHLGQPNLLTEKLRAQKEPQIVVIDEIQKLPELLNEVQSLIDKTSHRFILTGSSAKKLKRGSANLLGGRARVIHLMPFSYIELDDFSLEKVLNFGQLPIVWFSDNPILDLKSYIATYLKEEIQAEAFVRNLESFAHFIDLLGQLSGKELNYSNIASDIGLDSKTLKNYVEIIEDTLLGFVVSAFQKTTSRKAITRSKFYLFDVGLTNLLAKRSNIVLGSEAWGESFEQFIFLELKKHSIYSAKDYVIQFWRSTSQFEVDFILDEKIAIEVKASNKILDKHLKGLRALKEEKKLKIKRHIIICNEDTLRTTSDNIEIIPWKFFLDQLWQNLII